MKNQVLIFIEDGFRDEEAVYPYYRFIEAGYDVKVVGPEAKKHYTGKFGLPMESDLSPGQVKMDQVAAVIIPGGYAPDKMRLNKEMVKLLKNAFDRCKVIGAICHGGWMLAEADICRDKNVTGYIAIGRRKSRDFEDACGSTCFLQGYTCIGKSLRKIRIL